MTDETTTTEIVTHNKEPFVATLDNCLTLEECEHMINISKPVMKKSLVSFDKI